MGKRSVQHVDTSWGREEVFAETEHYVGKMLSIRSGESLGLHYHERRQETVRILEGRLDLFAGSDEKDLRRYELEEGMAFHTPPQLIHRLVAVTDCVVIEVSTPDQDDVVQLEEQERRVS